MNVQAGLDHTCAIKAGGTVWCWGSGAAGQLGVIGASTARTPIMVIGTYNAAQLSSGQRFWCIALATGKAQCTGAGARGQIGNGAAAGEQYPMDVLGLAGVTQVAAGQQLACAVSGGHVWCWGDGSVGELGDGQLDTSPVSSPVPVAGVDATTAIAIGATHVCALQASHQILCWGDTDDGRLGNRIFSPIARPGVPVQGVADATTITAGWRHSCAIRTGGTVWCWGDDTRGQLGDGRALTNGPAPSRRPYTGGTGLPTQVKGLAGITQITSFASTTCALRSDGTVWCWGEGLNGQLGNGSKDASSTAVQVKGLKGASQVSVGATHACAVTTAQVPYCWGSNAFGQLGDGGPIGTAGFATTPQLVQDAVRGAAVFLPTPITGTYRASRSGGSVELRQYRVRRKGSRCPTTAKVTVEAKGHEATISTRDVQRVSGGCAITGNFVLPAYTARTGSVIYTVRGDHLRTHRARLKPRLI